MKKIIAALALVMMLSAVVACSGNETAETDAYTADTAAATAGATEAATVAATAAATVDATEAPATEAAAE